MGWNMCQRRSKCRPLPRSKRGPWAAAVFVQQEGPFEGAFLLSRLVMKGSGGLTGLGLLESVAVAVGLEDVDVVGQAVEQGTGEAFGAKDVGPVLEWEV